MWLGPTAWQERVWRSLPSIIVSRRGHSGHSSFIAPAPWQRRKRKLTSVHDGEGRARQETNVSVEGVMGWKGRGGEGLRSRW